MKNTKNLIIIVIIISIILIGGIVLLITRQKSNLSSNKKNIIGETDITKKSYGYPSIRVLNKNNKEIIIDAGIYRFGDIDQDGIVGIADLDALNIMIKTKKVGFSNVQVKLADVNEDGNIDNKDVDLFNKYLVNKNEVKYNTNEELLDYCLTDTIDISTCKWQKSSKFTVVDVKDYYAFVKQNNNGRISEAMKLDKNAFEKLEI